MLNPTQSINQCSRQITTLAAHHSIFCKLDTFSDGQPTVSKRCIPDIIVCNVRLRTRQLIRLTDVGVINGTEL